MERRARIEEQQRDSWDRFSGGWAEWDEVVHQMHAPIGDEMIRLLDLRADREHLDIASGTGEPGLDIAELLPDGRVVLTDLSPAMLQQATAAAAARGLTNVEAHECSADALPFPDASFDSVSCRNGLMFFPDIPGALAEFARVLRPGGLVVVAVWAEPEGNPWATIPMAAIRAEAELPAPDPDEPGIFRCCRPGSIGEAFRAAGYTDVTETEVHGTLTTASAEQYWDYLVGISAPVVALLATVDDAARARIHDAVLDRIREFETEGRPAIPIHARCIAGTR